MKDLVVIGSGISGLSIARMVTEKFKVKILEKAPNAGGMIKCERVDGNLFHRVGGHVFNSRNEQVLNWFWSHFDRDIEFLSAKRNAKILMNDNLIGYPLENYLYQLPADILVPIINELLDLLKIDKKKDILDYDNFKDFLIGNFGEHLYNLYFGPYNSKIWNTDISKVPLEWLDGKLPMPMIKEVILSNIIKKEEAEMVHASFYYAKRDGSQFIVNKLAQGQDITLSYDVRSIDWASDEKLIINKQILTDVIIYTGDVRILHSLITINDLELQEALKSVTDLLSNGTSNILCETDSTDLSWLYLPEDKFKAHRIIYTGNFSETNNEGTDRSTCVVEFSGKPHRETMLAELRLLPGNLKPLEFNYEPNSYIIQQKGTRAKIERVKKALRPYNIFLLGRFSEWEYYNMDKCIESAMNLTDELIQLGL